MSRWGEPAYPSLIDRSGGPDACHPWMGERNSDGYGRLWVGGGKRTAVHRHVLAESLGRPIALGMFALHRCDNPPCCNPAHLFEGTNTDNMRDAASKGRCGGWVRPERVRRGEQHVKAKLTEAQVQDIRARFWPGRKSPTNSERLAAEFHVDRSTIRAVVTGSHWSHLRSGL